MTRLSALALSIAATAALTSPAFAEEPATIVNASAASEVQSTVVKFQDLNLSTPEGVERLRNRVKFAAKNICSVSSDRSLKSLMDGQQCLANSLRNAEPQIVAAVSTYGNEALASRKTLRIVASR